MCTVYSGGIYVVTIQIITHYSKIFLPKPFDHPQSQLRSWNLQWIFNAVSMNRNFCKLFCWFGNKLNLSLVQKLNSRLISICHWTWVWHTSLAKLWGLCSKPSKTGKWLGDTYQEWSWLCLRCWPYESSYVFWPSDIFWVHLWRSWSTCCSIADIS